jgi:hypothetical protein
MHGPVDGFRPDQIIINHNHLYPSVYHYPGYNRMHFRKKNRMLPEKILNA